MEKVYLVIILLLIFFLPQEGYSNQPLFGEKAKKSENIKIFPKWVKALDKTNKDFASFKSSNCEKNSKKLSCNYSKWQNFLSSIKDKSKKDQLNEVNEFANKHKYIIDMVNWGVEDYWESPREFLLKNGDCEDYAIIKYMSLRQLGFDVDNLRLVILNDNNLGVIHSVLAVLEDDETYILDNQISKVTSEERIFHYSPIYSINQKGWWKYI